MHIVLHFIIWSNQNAWQYRMKSADGVVENAHHRHIAIDQELGEQASIVMRYADYHDDFAVQNFFPDVHRLKSSLAEHEVCEWKIYRALDVPSFVVILRPQIKHEYTSRFVFEKINQIVCADTRWNLSLNVAELNAVNILKRNIF